MMAGFIKGVGEAFSYTPVPTLQTSPSGKVDYMQQLSPEAIQSAGMSGVGDAMDRIAKFYIDMAEGMYPVIEIDAGRTVEFVLNGGLRLKVI
jgi:conjugal transfer pilus assembly protein TraB